MSADATPRIIRTDPVDPAPDAADPGRAEQAAAERVAVWSAAARAVLAEVRDDLRRLARAAANPEDPLSGMLDPVALRVAASSLDEVAGEVGEACLIMYSALPDPLTAEPPPRQAAPPAGPAAPERADPPPGPGGASHDGSDLTRTLQEVAAKWIAAYYPNAHIGAFTVMRHASETDRWSTTIAVPIPAPARD